MMRTFRQAYYRLLTRFSEMEIPPGVGDFQLVDKRVIENMRASGESLSIHADDDLRMRRTGNRRSLHLASQEERPLEKSHACSRRPGYERIHIVHIGSN